MAIGSSTPKSLPLAFAWKAVARETVAVTQAPWRRRFGLVSFRDMTWVGSSGCEITVPSCDVHRDAIVYWARLLCFILPPYGVCCWVVLECMALVCF